MLTQATDSEGKGPRMYYSHPLLEQYVELPLAIPDGYRL